MKTEVVITKTEPEIKFPLLAKHKDGAVILFKKWGVGVAVVPDDETPIGDTANDWTFDETDRKEWTILPPGTKVTLIQE